MPFQPINFANIPTQGNPFARDLVQNLIQSLANGMKIANMPGEMSRQADKEQLANAFQNMQNQQEPQRFQSQQQNEAIQRALQQEQASRLNKMTPLDVQKEQIANAWADRLNASNIANQQANTRNTNTMTPLEAEKQRIANLWAPKLNQSTINYQAMGGSKGGGVGGKAEIELQADVAKDNPHLTTPEQIYEASNALRDGKMQLADGTKLNPMSAATRGAYDRVVKMGTTTTILNNVHTTKGREAEQPVLIDYITKGMKPYGDTVFGISPALEKDKLKSDDASQTRVGKFLGAQQLNFELANLSNALAQGQGGVTVINEMIDAGKQKINNPDLKISGKAREEALKYYAEAVNKAVKARLSNPSNASSVLRQPQKESGSREDKDPLGLFK